MALLIGWLDAALVGTCLALLFVVLTRYIPVRPAVRHLFWLVIALRFLVPSGPSWSWSPLESPLPSLSAWVSLSAPATLQRVGDVESGLTSAEKDGRYPISDAAALSPGALLLTVWLTSSLLVLLIRLGRYWRWRITVEGGGAAPPDLHEELQDVARMMGVEPPPVVLAARAASPRIVGCKSPILVWPTTQPQLSPSGRRGVLAHELAHLRRRDPWLSWIELLVGSLWWWYPPARLVQAELAAAAEEACDDWAVSLFPNERRSYAEALYAMAADSSAKGALPLTNPISGLAGIKRRLKGIVRHRHQPSPGKAGYGAAFVVALAVLPLSAFSPTGVSSSDPALDMAGIIGRGTVELDPRGRPVVGPDGWIVAFRATGAELRIVFASPGESRVLDQTGRPGPLGSADQVWLTQLADSTDWSVDPQSPRSASGAYVPDGPHMHRPTEGETVAVWSGIPEPFTTGGSLGEEASPDRPVVVVMWSDATDEARLYRLWRDGSGIVTGQIFEAAGQHTLAEADRFASTVAARVGARD